MEVWWMMKTNTDVTLYQRSVVAGAAVWTRSVIKEVFWEDKKAASGWMKADLVFIYLPMSAEVLLIDVNDIIVKGIAAEEISDSFTITDLGKEHKNVVKVRSVDTLDYGSETLQHIKLGCN